MNRQQPFTVDGCFWCGTPWPLCAAVLQVDVEFWDAARQEVRVARYALVQNPDQERVRVLRGAATVTEAQAMRDSKYQLVGLNMTAGYPICPKCERGAAAGVPCVEVSPDGDVETPWIFTTQGMRFPTGRWCVITLESLWALVDEPWRAATMEAGALYLGPEEYESVLRQSAS